MDKDLGLGRITSYTLYPRNATSFQVNLRESHTQVFLKFFTIVSYVKSIVRFVFRELLGVVSNESNVFKI